MNCTVIREPMPPRLVWALSEPGRFVLEISLLLLSHPFLRRAHRGDGHTVMVLPGFLAADSSTAALRYYMGQWGYDAQGWGLGRNFGLRNWDPHFENRLADRLAMLVRKSGRKVSLVGWSLGGVLARELARSCPDQVRQVISLGSPIGGYPKATTIWRLYEIATDTALVSELLHERISRMAEPVPEVPCTAIYSKTDGIVSHEIARERESALTQNIRVCTSHVGLGFSAATLYAIADRLAQDENDWQPFRRTCMRRMFYA